MNDKDLIRVIREITECWKVEKKKNAKIRRSLKEISNEILLKYFSAKSKNLEATRSRVMQILGARGAKVSAKVRKASSQMKNVKKIIAEARQQIMIDDATQQEIEEKIRSGEMS